MLALTLVGSVGEANARGLRILALLSTAPAWESNVHGTRPPPLAAWQDFVDRVSRRYHGRVAAYEIWNEPDYFDQGVGVGWSRQLGAPPTYADYLHAAGALIHANAPGTLVVGPATGSRDDANTREILRQIARPSYPDGAAAQSLDVISFHANASHGETSAAINARIAARLLAIEKLGPALAGKPVWITELGWNTRDNSWPVQAARIEELLALLTGDGGQGPGACSLNARFALTHAFIYTEKDGGDNYGVFTAGGSPKTVVTDFLATLPFPARQLNRLNAPFSVRCAGRVCTFASPAGASPRGEAYRQIYEWSFGDGTSTTVDGAPSVTHAYAAAGRYFVASGVRSRDAGASGHAGAGELGSDAQLIEVE